MVCNRAWPGACAIRACRWARYSASLADFIFAGKFVGRGDMSRGGLLLRKAREGVELPYAPVLGAVLHGARPPKLPPLARGRAGF